MSTNGTIRFRNKNGKDLISIYNHYDSYVEGLGKDISNFLNNIKVVNGISLGQEKEISNIANGFGDLIAQFIVTFKKTVGSIYVEEYFEQEYNYIIQETEDMNEFNIKVYEFEQLIFEGNKKQFTEFINSL